MRNASAPPSTVATNASETASPSSLTVRPVRFDASALGEARGSVSPVFGALPFPGSSHAVLSSSLEPSTFAR